MCMEAVEPSPKNQPPVGGGILVGRRVEEGLHLIHHQSSFPKYS